MASKLSSGSNIRAARQAKNWTQDELAQRAGISRSAVSSIESDRLVPSVAAALAVARALDLAVEELFGSTEDETPTWAWAPRAVNCRFWCAEVNGRNLLFPAEATAAGLVEHDGINSGEKFQLNSRVSPRQTLVIACCDPAAALLVVELSRSAGIRAIVLQRSSRQALTLLSQGLVHAAGLHLATKRTPAGNRQAVRQSVGRGYRLLRVAQWQEGVALDSTARVKSVGEAMDKKLRWIGREPGSGARQCLDEIFEGRTPPRRNARDHFGVAEAIRCGWADAGVCHQLVSEQAGLSFLAVRQETYEMCFSAKDEGDPRLRALTQIVRSARYRRLLSELPGYDAAECGELQSV